MIQLFRVFIPASVIGLVLSEFALIFFCYASAAALLYAYLVSADTTPTLFFTVNNGLARTAIVVACVVAGIYFQDLYANFRVRSITRLAQQLCMAIGAAFLFQSLLTYLKLEDWSFPKWAMILGSAFTMTLIPLWRMFYRDHVMNALGTRRILFLGTSDVILQIAERIRDHPELGMRTLGFVDNRETGDGLPGGGLLGPICALPELADRLKPDLIVVGTTERRQELPVNEMLRLRFNGVHFEEAPQTYETTFGRVLTRQMRPSRLIYSTELGAKWGSLFWHSLYSFLVAAVLVTVLSPVMLVVAILVRLTSRGPVFYRQKRTGLNQRVFTLYKFRSMYVDAEAGTGAVWAKKDDPRITPVGRWIRRLRLDELPQLLNVLKGEMSMVGPRPERPEFVSELTEKIPFYVYRHSVKPGITGWAQINFKYGDTLEDTMTKLEYDLYYIKNLALSLDTFIMFHTLKVMLFSETAQ
jgi:exopolysaccharide biosynthesis polyprenyl glycosylphosphotransferase